MSRTEAFWVQQNQKQLRLGHDSQAAKSGYGWTECLRQSGDSPRCRMEGKMRREAMEEMNNGEETDIRSGNDYYYYLFLI